MSRKDYRIIAEALRAAYIGGYCSMPAGHSAFTFIMIELATALKKDNSHFDWDKFHSAVFKGEDK